MGMGTAPACSLRIWSLPPNGTRGRALSIGCHAQCAHNATVRWLRTPVALSQYREEVAGSGSTLQLDHAEPRHQGHYQCILQGHHSQAVSLQLVVSDGECGSAAPALPPTHIPLCWGFGALHSAPGACVYPSSLCLCRCVQR